MKEQFWLSYLIFAASILKHSTGAGLHIAGVQRMVLENIWCLMQNTVLKSVPF